MKGLLVRLSRTDSEAEAALRVIEYFDALTAGRATIESLVRGAAALAECPAGIEVAGLPVLRFDARGNRLDRGSSVPSSTEESEGVVVWLERPDAAGPLDAIIVERLGVSARTLMPSRHANSEATLADVALVETVLSEREPAEERTKALRRLGLSPDRPLTVVAITPASADSDPAVGALRMLASSKLARAAHIASVDRVAAVLVQTVKRDMLVDLLPGLATTRVGSESDDNEAVRVGIGSQVAAMEAHRSWSQAVLALRFTGTRSPAEAVVDVETLGTSTVLSDVSASTWLADPHVSALRQLAASSTGKVDLAVLDAFLTTGSLRQAAGVLHMHHSSVASRLARVEERLGWTFSRSQDVFQAQLALVGLRLIDSAPQASFKG